MDRRSRTPLPKPPCLPACSDCLSCLCAVSAGLCYVLHEPQLQHCVPPCAVQAVLAFVTCLHSPEPLCRAALDLLMLLHTRLDLLAPSTDGMVTANAGPITMPDGTPVLQVTTVRPSAISGLQIHITHPSLSHRLGPSHHARAACPRCCSLGVLMGVYPRGLSHSCEGPAAGGPLPRPVPAHRGST